MILRKYRIKRLKKYIKKNNLMDFKFREIKFYLNCKGKHYNDFEIREALKKSPGT